LKQFLDCFYFIQKAVVGLILNKHLTYVSHLLHKKGTVMPKQKYDYKRYQRDKTNKKLNQRKYEELKETSTQYEVKKVKVGDREMTLLEAKDNMERRFRAEMYNRTHALSKNVSEEDLDYSRLTISFETKNRVENNFYGYQQSADNYLLIQNDSIRHFIESVVRRYKRQTGEELHYKYNIEVQLLKGTNLHAHVIFYHKKKQNILLY